MFATASAKMVRTLSHGSEEAVAAAASSRGTTAARIPSSERIPPTISAPLPCKGPLWYGKAERRRENRWRRRGPRVGGCAVPGRGGLGCRQTSGGRGLGSCVLGRIGQGVRSQRNQEPGPGAGAGGCVPLCPPRGAAVRCTCGPAPTRDGALVAAAWQPLAQALTHLCSLSGGSASGGPRQGSSGPQALGTTTPAVMVRPAPLPLPPQREIFCLPCRA